MNVKIIMGALLLLIVLSGTVVVSGNDQYNKELHEVQLEDGKYDGEDISVRLAPRGIENGEIASWSYEAEFLDDSGKSETRDTVGVIYEMSVTNNTANVVSDWEYDLYMTESLYLNSGWNGVFDIHQGTMGINPLSFATSDFNMAEASINYSNTHECLLIPMYKEDYFTYTPSIQSLEMPVPESDIKNNDLTTKMMGFILYTENDDRTYYTDFQKVKFRYHMHRPLVKNKAFICVLIAFVFWVLGLIEMCILNFQTKKLVGQRNRSMKIIEESMSTFANFIDAKDPNTRGHSVRVAQYTRMLAGQMGMSEEECTDIYYIALMHDCGKISIPQEILTKPGKLTDEEYEIMKSHSSKGYEMLHEFTSLPNVGLGAYCHHERYDGKGYPQGLSGEDIPLIGRMICIADAFDAMNSKRCYRDKLPESVIMEELVKNKGRQFDPKLIELFIGLINKGEIKI